MEFTPVSLTAVVRAELLQSETVTKFSPNRRFATVFSEGDPSESVYYLESGLVKLYKRDHENKEIILQILAPGELFGEQALGAQNGRNISAEILTEGVLYVIPRAAFIKFCAD